MRGVLRLLRTLAVCLLGAVVAVNLALLASRFLLKQDPPHVFGFYPMVVTTGSMEPNLPAGALVLVRAQEEYQVRDIISFRQGDAVVTHRVVEKTSEGYRTAGDANNVPDEGVTDPASVLGRVVLYVPWMGSAFLALRGPLGIFVLAAAGAALIFLPEKQGKERYEDTEKKA